MNKLDVIIKCDNYNPEDFDIILKELEDIGYKTIRKVGSNLPNQYGHLAKLTKEF